jgi:IS5 family transposase
MGSKEHHRPMGKGFGRKEQRRKTLEQSKDPLQQLNNIIEWEVFRPCWESIAPHRAPGQPGRKAIDRMLLFKLLVLQQMYNISDEQLEYQVHDRVSFRRFLGLKLEDEVPDATTVWLFRKQLQEAGLIEGLFEQFSSYLEAHGYQASGGQIIDATLIPVPKQRNHRDENEAIKQGRIPEEWKDTPHKLSQKDLDARWTQKNGENHYGYKDHINIDKDYGFIRRYHVTDASVHDSQAFCAVLDPDNDSDQIWADSAYRSKALEAALPDLNYDSQIHERGYRNHPLSELQTESNRLKSKVRATVEHVFGGWVTTMGGKLVRAIGLKAVSAQLGLKNLTYNLKRFVFWHTKGNSKRLSQCA